MQKTKCPVCQGAMRLRLPKEKARKVALVLLSIPALPGGTLVQRQGHPGRGASPARDGAALPGVRHADREARPGPHGALLLVLRALAQ